MVNLPIDQRLVHYFLAMGAQQTEAAQIPYTNLAFVSGSEKISVLILTNEEVLETNRILDTILALASLRNLSQLLYLAAPRLLGASVDAAIFRSHGIGLLLFDERRIDEALAPQRLQPSPSEQVGAGLTTEVMTELAALKSMYAEMEHNLARLRDDVEAYQRTGGNQKRFDPPLPSRIAPSEPTFVGSNVPGTPLPPFFVNNPWLDVLSKRGRSGNEQIAG